MSLSSPIPPGIICIPATIELTRDGDAIRWTDTPSKDRGAATGAPPSPDLLQKFSELFNAPPGKILLFARQHGVLGLNEDGSLPDTPSAPVGGLEPLDRWHSLASQVRSIRNLAALLQRGENIGPEDIVGQAPPACPHHPEQPMRFSNTEGFSGDEARTMRQGAFCVCPICSHVQPNTNFGSIARWASIELETFVPEDADYETIDGEKRYTGTTPPPGYFWQGKPFPAEKKKRLAIAQDCLDWTMEDWLFRFPSTIAMQRDAGVLEAKVAYSRGLLSALAMQLMQTAARRSVHLCSECREPFVRHGGSGGSATERKPRADRDEFCDACRERGAIGRRADARRREKKTRARQMYARGTDARTIAEKVGVRDPGTIELWAEKGNWNAKNAQAR